ncbi:MAG: hypothetical protein AAF485_19300, partial [Chloroflexota bacterium]
MNRRVLFWIIVCGATGIVVLMLGLTAVFQSRQTQAEATLIAQPTKTSEALEFLYQKGLGYINLGRWIEAQGVFNQIFEVDPNYKDVQAKLIEVEANITEEEPTTQITPTRTATSESPEAHTSANGLLASYPLDGDVTDQSGNGNHGTIQGAILTENRFGQKNSAYFFDGVDDYISFPSHFLGRGEFAISVWSNSALDNPSQYIMHTEQGSISYWASNTGYP